MKKYLMMMCCTVLTRCLMTMCVAVLLVSSASAQEKKTVPPPPKPADDGPSLKVTMKFIQDKMNDQGAVGFAQTWSDYPAVIFRNFYLISGTVADADACSLHLTETFDLKIEVAAGSTYSEGGKLVSGDDLIRRYVRTNAISLKDVQSIGVEGVQDDINRSSAQAGYPDRISTITPPAFLLSLQASKPTVLTHVVSTLGKRPPSAFDAPPSKGTAWRVRDEETANRMAKAMVHAVELCGGRSKPEPF